MARNSTPLLVLLAVACALILLLAVSFNPIAANTTLSDKARSRYSSHTVNFTDQATKTRPSQSSRLSAFVGVFTAIKPERRRVVRATWFPSSSGDLQRFEEKTGIRLRFVVGKLQDPQAQAALQEEQRDHADFEQLPVTETYDNLVLKVYTFLQQVQAAYNPDFIVKTDDDVYIRPDRLAQAIPQWQAEGAGYIGVMRVGTEAHDMNNSPWYEPLGVLNNKQYYMYASGGMYALSAEATHLLTRIPLSQRRLAGGGDDTSIGLWVLGYNIPYMDDRRLGMYYEPKQTDQQQTCPDNFVVLTGLCNGLCDPEETIAKLHKEATCTKALSSVLSKAESWYDYSAVGCIKVDQSGNVNKSLCFA